MEEEVKTRKNWKICSGFILKLIAFLTMTIDHIGVMAEMYYLDGTWSDIFRMIGRIAMPLFCFMIVEGVIHTKSFAKYALRLGILTLIIGISLLVMVSVPHKDAQCSMLAVLLPSCRLLRQILYFALPAYMPA